MKSLPFMSTALLSIIVVARLFSSEPDAEMDVNDFIDFGEDATGIVVFGTPETTAQTQVIERDRIERSGARDLAALLEEEIGMSVTRQGGYGNRASLSMRGFDTSRITILVDGIPVNSLRSGGFDMSQIDLANVQRIEVIYGGSDTQHNIWSAPGGVINIITIGKQSENLSLGFVFSNTGYMPGKHNLRHPATEIGGPDFEDLFDMQSLSIFAGRAFKNFAFRASVFGNIAGNRYLYRDDFGFARRRISNEVIDGGGELRLAFGLPNDAKIIVTTSGYHARRNFPITMNSVGTVLATDTVLSGSASFSAPTAFRDDLETEASLAYRLSFNNYGAIISGRDRYVMAISRWNWYPAPELSLLSGIHWHFLHVDSGNPVDLEPEKTAHFGGAHVTGEYRLSPRFFVVASLKGLTDTKRIAAIPKAGIRWQASEAIALKHNYFRSFQFPSFDDLYYRSPDNSMTGNPDLDPEDGWGADLIGDFLFGGAFSFSAGIFGHYAIDLIRWTTSGGRRWRPENIGAAYFAGADFRPALTLSLGEAGPAVALRGSYQFLHSRLLSDGENFRVPYSPTHVVGAGLELRWPSTSLLLSLQYRSQNHADPRNRIVVDPSVVANATFNQNLWDGAVLFASLRNILNAAYESFSAYPMPGITLTLGFRLNIEVKNPGDE
ncbi:MAG: TonB-dependent receptor [Treponema sp.]|nr:TonB-dependent receptor [Treponema sp.]